MRTKTLLIAAAALAATVISSQAQVYSANIVGYVNFVSSTVSPKFEMICNPLDNGTNTVASLFPAPPGGTSLQLWSGSAFSTITYAPKLGGWGANGSLVINPGKGVFISVGGTSPYTNTFVGNVVPNTGLNGTNVIGTGFQTASSLVPYTDSVTNTSTINLVVPGGTQLQAWNPVSQTFNTFTYSPKLGGWTPSVPVLSVGQGVFIQNTSGGPINWVETGP